MPYRTRVSRATGWQSITRTYKEIFRTSAASDSEFTALKAKNSSLETFKAISMWATNFMRRNNMHRSKGICQAGNIDSQTLYNARRSLQKTLCTTYIAFICNTDEVAILYGSFPSRAIRTRENLSPYTRVKVHLTALLTVYAIETKAPLTIIDSSRKPRNLRRHFDGAKDVSIF